MFKIDNYIIEEPLIDILKTLQGELTNGKLRTILPSGNEYKVPCPVHSEGLEKKEACFITEEGVFHCFVCNESGNLQKFVGLCFDKDEYYGKTWLISHFGKELYKESLGLEPIKLSNKQVSKKYLDESILDSFQSYHPYMTKRKLSQSTCEKFKVKYDPNTTSIVFPVWDLNNKLLMLTKRSVNSKKFIIDKGIEKPVYLLNYIVNNKLPYVIIAESQINCLYCHSLNIAAVATFGCHLTANQLNQLKRSGIHNFIIMYDGDTAGAAGAAELKSKLEKFALVTVVNMPFGKDINDLSKDEFIQVLAKNNLSYDNLSKIYLEHTKKSV